MIKSLSKLGGAFANCSIKNYAIGISYYPLNYFAEAKQTGGKDSNAKPESKEKEPLFRALDDIVSPSQTNSFKFLSQYDFQKQIIPEVTKLLQLGVDKDALSRIAEYAPEALVTEKFADCNTVSEFSNYLKKTYGFDNAEIKEILIKAPRLLKITQAQLEENVKLFQQKFQLSKEEIAAQFKAYPPVFKMPHDDVVRKAEVVKDYIPVDDKQIGRYQVKAPYFISTPLDCLKGTLEYMLRMGFKEEQVIKIVDQYTEVVTQPVTLLKSIIDYPKNHLNIGIKTLAEIYTENPRLLGINAHLLMSKKVHALNDIGFTDEQVRDMFIKYPRIFVKSLASFTTKLKYLTQRQKLNLQKEPAFPLIMNYHYGRIIRPRGEILLSKNKQIPWIEVLEMTEEEFCKAVGATAAELNAFKEEKFMTLELDLNRRFYSRIYDNTPKTIDY